MDDLISRQAAIKRIRGMGYADEIKNNVILALLTLPTVGPSDGYVEGWKDGRQALREEIWEDGRD